MQGENLILSSVLPDMRKKVEIEEGAGTSGGGGAKREGSGLAALEGRGGGGVTDLRGRKTNGVESDRIVHLRCDDGGDHGMAHEMVA